MAVRPCSDVAVRAILIEPLFALEEDESVPVGVRDQEFLVTAQVRRFA